MQEKSVKNERKYDKVWESVGKCVKVWENAVLGRLGSRLGRSWGRLGAVLGGLQPSWCRLGQSWSRLGSVLGSSWAVLGHLGREDGREKR